MHRRLVLFALLLLTLCATAPPLAAQEEAIRLDEPLLPMDGWLWIDRDYEIDQASNTIVFRAEGETPSAPPNDPPAPEPPSRMAPGVLCARDGACTPVLDLALMRKNSVLMPGRWASLNVLGGDNLLGLGAALDLFGRAAGTDSRMPRLRLGLAMSGEFDWTELLGVISGDPEASTSPSQTPGKERLYELGLWLAMGLR